LGVTLSASSNFRFEIRKLEHSIGFDANAALTNMDAAVRLCSIYPGNNPVIPQIKSPQEPFSFKFDDISLKDIMVHFWVLCSVSHSKGLLI